MSHANARLTVHGRRMLVQRVIEDGRPVAHVAKEMGISRQCAHRWIDRYRAQGEAGLADRSSRPRSCPHRTPAAVEDAVITMRREQRRGQDWIGPELGVPARTVSAILRRHQMPYLRDCDPLTGEVIKASKVTTKRYEHPYPGSLVHVDVKKIGRIPDGGGWRAHGRAAGDTGAHKRARIGFDFVHSMVDDHSRWSYSEVLPNEKGTTCAQFMLRAAAAFAALGVAIERVMTDNHWSYTHSTAFADALTDIDAKHVRIRPHCPWQNGKVERFNRTLQTEWAYRQVYTSNAQRTAALDHWLHFYNTERRHSAIGGNTPISRLSPT